LKVAHNISAGLHIQS